MPIVRAVIGKNFGDEGKGLAVNYFCSQVPDTLVIKHNGGAQAGHTVETDGKRFVFHQLSAGSFCNADTFWADSYYPDLYKLSEEMEAFRDVAGFYPGIYCDTGTNVTLIDDVLINMITEVLRGKDRHGSCGMGINECDLRTKAGYGIKLMDFLSKDTEYMIKRVKDIREYYSHKRLDDILAEMNVTDINLNLGALEYFELLRNDEVIKNAVMKMQENAYKYVRICEDAGNLFNNKKQIIFESGQGLLLDGENKEYAPHVTASRTGLYNPCRILGKYKLKLNEAVYVSRIYMTRHGAGPLPNECKKEDIGILKDDATNVYNEWQGSIRYARHGSFEDFTKTVKNDIDENNLKPEKVSLFLTHLNETDNKIKMTDTDSGIVKDITIDEFINNEYVNNTFDMYYLSDAPDKAGIKECI